MGVEGFMVLVRVLLTCVRTYASNKPENISPLVVMTVAFAFHLSLCPTCMYIPRPMSFLQMTFVRLSDVGNRMIIREGKQRHGCEGTNLLKRDKGKTSKDRYITWVK
jgi:hypothetical protein